MTPTAFIAKWKAAELKESAAAQSHFNDLCAMLGEPTPTEADPKGEWYAFEKGATKTTGGEGWADVWKRGHFGWEYKGKTKSLDKAFAQLQQYALALENPPLLVVCDLDRFRIHTNWTNTVSEVHEFTLDDLADAKNRQKLKWVLSDPEKLRPQKTRQKLTEEVAAQFAALAQRLRARGHPAETVAHFVNRLIFCMFAEDVKLLPNKLFTKMLKSTAKQPEQFARRASELFKAMKAGGEAAHPRARGIVANRLPGLRRREVDSAVRHRREGTRRLLSVDLLEALRALPRLSRVKRPKVSFHSFRHTFEDACRACGVSHDAMNALQGHSQGA